MVTLTLEENEIDIILNLVNRKIEKINDKEIDENQIQTKKEFEIRQSLLSNYLMLFPYF